jgi:hypothetical protein
MFDSSVQVSRFLDVFANGEWTVKGKAGNLIFAHERDTRMGLSIDDELFEHLRSGGTACDAIVRAHRHHATPHSGLGIERVELGLEVVSIHGSAEVSGFIVHNVVHVEGIGHDGKWLVAYVYQEWLIAAYVVNVVDEAERLKNFQGVRSIYSSKTITSSPARR